MPSIDTMNVAALIATVFALVLGSVVLLLNTRRKPRRPVMSIVGLLISGTGALLGEIARMARTPQSVPFAVDTVGWLLALGGLVCILVGVTRRDAPRPAPFRQI